MGNFRLSHACAVLLCLAAASPNANAVDVSLLVGHGSDSRAYGINSAGEVAGYVSWSYLPGVATTWSGLTNTSLGVLPGYRSAEATAVNDSGIVVGISHTSDGSYYWSQQPNPTQATIWTGSTATSLTTLSGYDSSAASGINASGIVVGRSYANNNASQSTQRFGINTASQASMWQNNVVIALPNLIGTTGSSAGAINNMAQIVGTSYKSNGDLAATMWTDGSATALGNLTGYTQSAANDINNTGTVVGYTLANDGKSIATAWHDGVATALVDVGSTDSSQASAINDGGWIVGKSTGGATLWADGRAINLNSFLTPAQINAGLSLDIATDINNQGVITGIAVNHWGNTFGFVVTGIPEPASWSIFALGLIGLAGAVRVNRRAH